MIKETCLTCDMSFNNEKLFKQHECDSKNTPMIMPYTHLSILDFKGLLKAMNDKKRDIVQAVLHQTISKISPETSYSYRPVDKQSRLIFVCIRHNMFALVQANIFYGCLIYEAVYSIIDICAQLSEYKLPTVLKAFCDTEQLRNDGPTHIKNFYANILAISCNNVNLESVLSQTEYTKLVSDLKTSAINAYNLHQKISIQAINLTNEEHKQLLQAGIEREKMDAMLKEKIESKKSNIELDDESDVKPPTYVPLDDEVFVPVEEYKGQTYSRYEVSNYGTVKSKCRKKVKYLKEFNRDGYNFVSLTSDNQKFHTFYIHRLVCHHFVMKNTDHDLVVNHKNRNRQDNYYKNLEWVTQRENVIHGRGIAICRCDILGKTVVFRTLKAAAESIDVSIEKIITYCNEKKNDPRGYVWRYCT